MVDLDDDASLLAAFRSQAISRADWSHRAHVRIGYLHLLHAELEVGRDKQTAVEGVEPSKVEPSKVEPSKVEPSKVEPSVASNDSVSAGSVRESERRSISVGSLRESERRSVSAGSRRGSERDAFEDALAKLRFGIMALNTANGVPNTETEGYHETITVAFLRLVEAMIRHYGVSETSNIFCDAHPQLLSKYVLRLFYSRDVINSTEARARFIPPDISCFPD